MQRAIWVLWPSFIVAGVAEVVFFTLIDPMSLQIFDEAHDLGRTTVYSIAFFALWLFAATSSALTCFFQRTAAEINRCPLTPTQRPVGCPKREESDACC
ncbi:MAG TPA: hypothetical protein VIQ28_07110 [Burkholderiales bacterium]|nr:hypothetical protein [Bryobacteraceae bacterium]